MKKKNQALEIQTYWSDDPLIWGDNENCFSGWVPISNTVAQITTYTDFTLRNTKPIETDKFVKCYIRSTDGGWSEAIKGSPTDKICTVLSNCVGYAQGRFCEIYNEIKKTTGNKYKYFNCNANNFIKRARNNYPELEIGDSPRPGSILVMDNGGAGHVIIVEQVNTDGSIYTSESSYGGQAFYNKTRYYDNGHWGMSSSYKQIGFIYNPAVTQTILPDVTPIVARNPEIDQIEVTSEVQHVRQTPTLNSVILGHTSIGYYDCLESIEADGYIWYKIAEGQWVAKVGQRVVFLPKIVYYNIKINDSFGGTIICDKTRAISNELVKLQIELVEEFELEALYYNNTPVENFEFSMPAEDVVLSASFVKKSYPITCIPVNGGSIIVSSSEAHKGDIIFYEAKPKEGFKLKFVLINGIENTGDFFIMPNSAVEIKGVFSPIIYFISCKSSEYGLIEVDISKALFKEEIHITVTPNKGYQLDTILVNNEELKDLTFVMPASDVVVEGIFKKKINIFIKFIQLLIKWLKQLFHK